MSNRSIRMTFPSRLGHELAARLDMPVAGVRAYALFAHCFTCTKDIFAARRIAATLASLGVAVLRFDFTGLGSSAGEFQNTNFSSNVEDLVRAADHLREHYRAPAIVIGHSLGGAAVLAAAHRMPEAKAIVTIGAPFDVAHVLHHFQAQRDDIERDGIANVTLAGRTFSISKGLIEDAKGQALQHHVVHLHKALLVYRPGVASARTAPQAVWMARSRAWAAAKRSAFSATCQPSASAFQCSTTTKRAMLPSSTVGITAASVPHITPGASVVMRPSWSLTGR